MMHHYIYLLTTLSQRQNTAPPAPHPSQDIRDIVSNFCVIQLYLVQGTSRQFVPRKLMTGVFI